MLVAQLLEDGRDSLAGTAPGGEVVDDDGAVGALNLGLEVGSAVGGKLGECRDGREGKWSMNPISQRN